MNGLHKPKKRLIYSFKGTVAELKKICKNRKSTRSL